MENGPVAELRDPENDYGLRITAMASTIRAIRVYAPLDGSFISIQPQFNYDDPFGREWGKNEDTGMVVLQPGQAVVEGERIAGDLRRALQIAEEDLVRQAYIDMLTNCS